MKSVREGQTIKYSKDGNTQNLEDWVILYDDGKNVEIDLPKFTLIGATTRAGSLTTPLRDRFGVLAKFDLYTVDELAEILKRTAGILNVGIDTESTKLLASRSRGTPRVANRLLKRVRDFSQVKGNGNIDAKIVMETLESLGIDDLGLEELDRKILGLIINNFKGGPVGIDTIAASLGEERVTIEDAYEPYLMQKGLLLRTPKGRMISDEAYGHIGLDIPHSAEE